MFLSMTTPVDDTTAPIHAGARAIASANAAPVGAAALTAASRLSSSARSAALILDSTSVAPLTTRSAASLAAAAAASARCRSVRLRGSGGAVAASP